MNAALTSGFPHLSLSWKRSEDFCWAFAGSALFEDLRDSLFCNGHVVAAKVLPRTAGNNAIDSAVGQTKAFSYLNLRLSISGSLKNIQNGFFREFFAPTTRLNGISNVISVREPFKVLSTIIQRVMVNVGCIRQIVWIWYESLCNEPVDLELAHNATTAKNDHQPAALSSASIIGVGFKNSFSNTMRASLAAEAAPSLSRGYSLKAFDATEVADFVQSFVSNDGSPLFTHKTSPLVTSNVMDANKKFNREVFGRVNFGKKVDKSCR